MSKTLSAAILSELSTKTHHWTLELIEIIIDPTDPNAILRLTNHYQDITFDSNVYTASGSMLGIGQYQENIEATNDALQVSLSAIDSAVFAAVLDNPVAGSTVKIYKAFLDEDLGTLIGDPYLVWSGIANSYSIDDNYEHSSSDTVNISLSCKSLLSTLMERQSGLYTSMPSYQFKYPTDYSMEFVAGLSDRSFNFGKEK